MDTKVFLDTIEILKSVGQAFYIAGFLFLIYTIDEIIPKNRKLFFRIPVIIVFMGSGLFALYLSRVISEMVGT